MFPDTDESKLLCALEDRNFKLEEAVDEVLYQNDNYGEVPGEMCLGIYNIRVEL